MFELAAGTSLHRVPEWAMLQRDLFDVMADAVDQFVEDYIDENGEPYWPPVDHVGIDGFDDVIEGFHDWPLVYAMGGDERLLDHARTCYEGALRRGSRVETPFGHSMVVDDFEQCRDWFHLGEGNRFTYNMGLAAPDDERFRERAVRFAELYLPGGGVDNYDPEHNIIRGPMNGSMGPEYCDFSAYEHHPYGADYRWRLHGLPWKDIEGIDDVTDASDPANEDRLLEAMTERCSRGDIPLNMGATSLVANAYLHTGDERYRDWVVRYVEGWHERASENDGLVPDNVGLSGDVGAYTGDWYGGYYGWSWGGWHYVGAGVTVGSENAALLTGDREHMAFLRSQLDVLMDNSISVSADPVHETRYLPHKYGDPGDYHYDPGTVLREADGEVYYEDGWFEFYPLRDTPYVIHLWYLTMDPTDRERIRTLRNWESRDWKRLDPRAKAKHGSGQEYAWLAYLDGEFEDYPVRLLEAAHARVHDRLDVIRTEGGPPDDVDEDYLRNRNPATATALLQLTMGAPQPVYYGGLLHSQVRYFDPDRRRPGLPEDVSALVEDVSPAGVDLTLVNGGARHRDVIVQAGAYGEHEFAAVESADGRGEPNAGRISVSLPGRTRLSLTAAMNRLVNQPRYDVPWEGR
ncbi:hypothetical protein ACOZ4I_17720 (plasmid) [Haloarcula salina]|uniref:hypothetical protein n=1 Tax=Haloarcula salina TaxID=1429914 RepID=UPI003C6F86E9